jgi:hypothetical protein
MKTENIKFIQGVLILLIPLFIVGSIVGVFRARKDFLVLMDEFKPGFLKVTDLDCKATTMSVSAPTWCYAHGRIINKNGKRTEIEATLSLGYDFDVDFNKQTYQVFYRENGRFPIENPNGKDELDKRKYIKRAGLSLFIPLLLIGFSYLYYKKLELQLQKMKK